MQQQNTLIKQEVVFNLKKKKKRIMGTMGLFYPLSLLAKYGCANTKFNTSKGFNNIQRFLTHSFLAPN